MMRWLWLLFLLLGMGSARADAPRWEDIPLPAPGQALVDTTGTVKPDTLEEVNRLAAGLSARGQVRMVVVVLPRASEGLDALARELYDSWQVAGGNTEGAVFVLALEDRSVRFEPSWILGTSEDFQAVRESAEQAMRAQTEPDGAVRAAARVFAEWMEKAAARPERTTVLEPEPFAAFLERPHSGVADPDRLLTPELTRKARQNTGGKSPRMFVVYDRARHPVRAHVLAESLTERWTRSHWLVVVSTPPVEVSIIPPEEQGGYRRDIPKAALLWKEAMEQLGREPSSPATAAAWDRALEKTKSLDGDDHPSWQELERTERSTSSSATWVMFLLPVGLFLLAKNTLGRFEDGKGPHSVGTVILYGLPYTVAYGCAIGWVIEQSEVFGIFAAFFSFPWVFIGVRRFCAWCDFNPFYAIGSACPLVALGLFFSLVAFSSDLFLVGPLVRTVEVRELPRATGGAFHLRDAALRKDYSANRRIERGTTGMKSATLAPLVGEGWTPDQPVPAWLLCRHHRNYEEECNWDGPITDVVAPTSWGVLATDQVIARAELITGLRSAPGARLLSRSEDAEASVSRVLRRGLLLPLLFVGAFVFFAIYGPRWDEAARRERPSQRPATRSQKKKARHKSGK